MVNWLHEREWQFAMKKIKRMKIKERKPGRIYCSVSGIDPTLMTDVRMNILVLIYEKMQPG